MEKTRHLFHQCEPDVWCVLVADSLSLPPQLVREEALRDVLRELAGVARLAHGALRAALDADPSAASVRAGLGPLVADYAARLGGAGELGVSAAADIQAELLSPLLGGSSRLLTLPLERAAFLAVQAAAAELETAYEGRVVLHTALLHDRAVAWSALAPHDTAALHALALRCLLPPPGSSSGRGGAAGPRTGSDGRGRGAEAGASSGGSPLDPARWRLGKGGVMEYLDGSEGGSSSGGLPTVYLCGGREPHLLLALRRGPLLLLLLLAPDGFNGGGSAGARGLLQTRIAHLTDLAAPHLAALGPLLAGQPSPMQHVRGLRYLFLDRLSLAVRASPPAKASTLSREALAALHQLRAQLDDSAGAAAAAAGTSRAPPDASEARPPCCAQSTICSLIPLSLFS